MDANEYNACVHQWSDSLFRFACKCTGGAADAHDIVQNSFEVLWEKRNDVEPGKAKAFLFQVAYRQSVDHYRKKARTDFTAPPEKAYTPTNPDVKEVLEKALAKLSEQSRALVLLKDYEGYRYEEIAKITGLTEAQVKVYLFRARKILKERLVSIHNII